MSETIKEIGEFGLIDKIHKLIAAKGVNTPGITLGIGDDTAAFLPRSGYELLVTCDCMVEGRHYLPDRINPKDLGRRVMSMNISDIGAMGGYPLYAMISLGLRQDMLVSDVEAIYRGFLWELNPLGASIIGGNLTSSSVVFMDITLIGEVEQGKKILRSTARPGDSILVTGYPGEAACGLQILMDSSVTENVLENPLVKRYNTPGHRIREAREIASSTFVTAMIDISDGFLGDLAHICEESHVGAELIKSKIPISDQLKKACNQMGKDPYQTFLGDSDDYELIFTCSPDSIEYIRKSVHKVSDVAVAQVGTIVESTGEIKLVLPDGLKTRLTPSGWDHFSK